MTSQLVTYLIDNGDALTGGPLDIDAEAHPEKYSRNGHEPPEEPEVFRGKMRREMLRKLIKREIYEGTSIEGIEAIAESFGNRRCMPALRPEEIKDVVLRVVPARLLMPRPESEFEEDQAPWQKDLIRNKEGDLRSTGFNATVLFSNHPDWAGVLAFDEFAQAIVKRRKPPWSKHDGHDRDNLGAWTDEDDRRATNWLDRHLVMLSTKTVHEVVRVVADKVRVHPVREYLEGLKHDGTPRVLEWVCDYLGVEKTVAATHAGAWWLISAVARIFEPGCKTDHMLILEGPQGIGKSSALRTLAGEWFADTPVDLSNKDAFLSLKSKWILEWGELETMRKAETSRLKAFVSSPVDHYRPPYGRETRSFPRQCVFAGTSNGDLYLKDSSGNRRFWPVKCGKIDLEALARDRDQLWAEAVALYREGFKWWPATAHEAHLLAEEAEQRYQVDPWESIAAAYIDGREFVTTNEVLLGPIKRNEDMLSKTDAMRVGECLRRLGWGRKKRRVQGRPTWVYEPTQEVGTGGNSGYVEAA